MAEAWITPFYKCRGCESIVHGEAQKIHMRGWKEKQYDTAVYSMFNTDKMYHTCKIFGMTGVMDYIGHKIHDD